MQRAPRRAGVFFATLASFVIFAINEFAFMFLRERRAPTGTGEPLKSAGANYAAQSTQPVHAVSNTITPNTMRYHANGTKSCVDT